jgi:translocation and assembly module TamB
VQAVEVVFNPIDLLLTRTLNLDVTLAQPNLYLDQAKDGRWLTTPITPREREGLIETNLQAVRLRDGNAIIAPKGISPRSLKAMNSNVLFVDESKQLRFDATAQALTGGKLQIEGEWFRPTQRVVLTAQGQDLTAKTLTGLASLPLQLQAGLINGQVKAQFRQNQQPDIEGTAQIRSATVVVPDQYLLKSSRPVPRTFRAVNGVIQLLDRSQRLRFDLKGQVIAGGKLGVKGEWFRPTQQGNLIIQAQNLPARILDGAFKLPIAISTGRVDSNLSIQLRQNQPPSLKGTARLRNVTTKIANLPRSLTNVAGRLRFNQGLVTNLEDLRALYGKIPVQVSGAIDPDRGFNLSGQTRAVRVADALNTFGVRLPLSTAGSIQGQDLRITGSIKQPLLSGAIAATQAQIDRVDFSSLTARFQLKAPVLTLSEIQATPVAGGVITGGGRVNLRARDRLGLNLQARGVPGDAIARIYGVSPDVTIGSVSAQARISDVQTSVQFQAPEAKYPTTGQVIVSGGKTLLRNIVAQVAGGTVKANGQIADGRLQQATIQTAGIALRQFSPNLRGLLSGQFDLTAPLASFKPDAIRAQGRVRFSQGLSIVQQPLTAQVRLEGQTVVVEQATAPGFRANGTVLTRLRGPEAPQISAFNLNVQAQDYSLQALSLSGANQLALRGQADFTGRLTGTPTIPDVRGALRLNNFALNQVAFEPTLTGNLSYTKQGLDLRVAGNQDRINLALNPNFRPKSFYIRQDQAVALGQTRGENLLIDLQQFPLAVLNLNPGRRFGQGPIAGLVSGDFTFNLRTSTLAGDVAIAKPRLGTINADQFTGQIRFANGVATLSNGELRQANSQYLISGTFEPGADPRFAGQVKVAQAEVQEILTALQFFDVEDIRRGLRPPTYAKAAAVQPRGVGMPEASLETQLRRLSEIETLLAQQVAQREAASPLPDLAELQGDLRGQIAFSGSQRSGITANFDLQGQDFDWGPYQIEQLIATGSFNDGVLALRPLRLQSGESLLAFTGQVGEQQSGQLRAENVPIETLQDFVDLPVDLTGKLNGTATIAGSLNNPQARGQLNLASATINQKPVESALGSFSYNNSRLNFDSTVLVSGPEPVQIAGSIPYQLPFVAVPPASNQISLDADVKNEGLALLSLFTPQVAWVDGTGQADLRVRGTLEQPLVDGIVTAANATIRAQALPEPLMNVNGIVRFNRDRIRVEQLTGQLNQGQVAAAGVIPIFAPLPAADPDRTTPLTIRSQRLALNLQNRYNGGVNGNLIITGSVLSPELGGTIQLANGQVLLTDTSSSPEPGRAGLQPAPTASDRTSDRGFEASPLQFNNLRISLGNNVQINRPPLLNFLASGNLTLNGPTDNIRPQGTIRLQQGQVNLFTTRFRLDRDESNFAEFDPNYPLDDPYINATLRTTVTEVTGGRSTVLNEFGDQPATALGSAESVRVQARVTGRAREIINNFESNVELTSSPFRSQDEIIALIGGIGGDINNPSEANGTLALANIAGSAFFNNIQGLFGDLQDRVDFRLFPTLTPPTDESGDTALNLGAELGYDVTRRLSVSILQVVTAPEEPTQLNLSYDLNDQIRLRGSTNIQGESVGAVEYRTRF